MTTRKPFVRNVKVVRPWAYMEDSSLDMICETIWNGRITVEAAQ